MKKIKRKKISLYNLQDEMRRLDDEIYFLKFCQAQTNAKILTIDKLIVKETFFN